MGFALRRWTQQGSSASQLLGAIPMVCMPVALVIEAPTLLSLKFLKLNLNQARVRLSWHPSMGLSLQDSMILNIGAQMPFPIIIPIWYMDYIHHIIICHIIKYQYGIMWTIRSFEGHLVLKDRSSSAAHHMSTSRLTSPQHEPWSRLLYTWTLLCRSFLVMTCFLITGL